ncbi:MAG: helix-turn-helix domain-containing protein [Clostridia bacterium]|nr:helix-turn-helix domain-containing protein [Clostridia bacterium]
MPNTLIAKYAGENLSVRHSVDISPSQDSFFLHAHRTYELFYFISGDCYYTVEGTDYPLTPGCILIMRSGEAHTLHLRSGSPYERITVNFAPSIIPLLGKEIGELFCDRPLGKRNLYVPTDENRDFLRSCMLKISRETSSDNSEGGIISNLMPILVELYRLNEQNAEINRIQPPSQGSSETVSKIIEYINTNLVTIKGLDELEKEFFFSKSYINRIFKESTGSSVWDYIVLKRLLLSRSLLQNGKQANIVASECGFCDYSSFYRQFKQRFGISPLSARKTK